MSLSAAFRDQAAACVALGSPFMGRLMTLFAERLSPTNAVAARVLDWPGDPAGSADSVPLRLAGALHALKLEGLTLADVYPPAEVGNDRLWAALEDAMETHAARLLCWLDSAPQTNEVRRAAVLLPVLARLARRYPDRPVELLELGASGGLNLRADRFRLGLPRGGLGPADSTLRLAPAWQGPAPVGPLPEIASRRGVDLNPLDPGAAEDRLRLLAYLWPDQTDRIARTEAAIAIAREHPAELDRCDAADWAEAVLADPAPDRVRLVYHTVAWQYFPQATRARIRGALAGVATPLVQFGMEAGGDGDGAALTWTAWPEGKVEDLGRADFHGRWVIWQG